MATKKNVTEEIKETIEKVETTAAKTAKKAAATTKKAEAAVAETAKKAEAKVAATAKKTETKVAATAKKTTKAATETVKKAAKAVVPEVFVQFQGKEVAVEELVERAKAAYHAENKGTIRGLKLYVKPEDGACYYVIGDVTGKVEF